MQPVFPSWTPPPSRYVITNRISRHQVFAGSAARGKTSMGWFNGFKLHLSVNGRGEILACQLTPGLIPGNVDDRKPVPNLAKTWFGKLCGDKGYISQPLFDQLRAQGLELITPRRKNMKQRSLPLGGPTVVAATVDY